MNIKRKNILLIISLSIITIGIFFLILTTLFQISKARSFQFFGELIDRVVTDQKVIALTFDDAPTEFTPEVLQTLQEKQIKATFFAIGAKLADHPEIGKQIVMEGHQLGNHSYSHPRFLLKSQKTIDEEIQKTNTLIREAGYTEEIVFRPPNGKKLFGLPWYLSHHNIKTIMWDVEPDTFAPTNSSADFLVKYTIEHTKPGSIILLHPFCRACTADREAIPQIIEQLQAKGYQFVTVSELLKYND